MAYRLDNNPPSPERFIPRYHVRNGATAQLYFDCYYWMPQNAHDPAYHDFINWPSANYHPGNICQMHPPRGIPKGYPPFVYVGEDTMVPIDFTEEGYTGYSVVFDDPDDLTPTVARYTVNGEVNTLLMTVTANLALFTDNAVERNFTIFATRPGATDAVCHGTLVILPGSPSV